MATGSGRGRRRQGSGQRGLTEQERESMQASAQREVEREPPEPEPVDQTGDGESDERALAPDGGPADDEVLEMATEYLRIGLEACKDNYDKGREDVRMRLGQQWPTEMEQFRRGEGRPVETFNKETKFVEQVVNPGRESRPSIIVKPQDDKSDPKLAEIWQGLIRAIEADSVAYVAYDTALEHGADRGCGYIRVVTEYVDEDSFDQVLKIKRVRNPFAVVLDPMAMEPDGSDAKWAFVLTEYDEEEFERDWPGHAAVDVHADEAVKKTWRSADDEKVRVGEFFWIQEEREYISRGQRRRARTKRTVWWFLLSGAEVLERTKWAGKRYIPIARCLGTEIDLDGELHTESRIRHIHGAQRLYNYTRSTEIETLGLQTKIPWMGTAKMFAGYEGVWDNSHRMSSGRLLFNADPAVNGAFPKRVEPPVPNMAARASAQDATVDMHEITGMYPANFGAPSQEQSGKALRERKVEGDEGSAHFHLNQQLAVLHVGRIILDAAPAVYDTKRVARIMGEDGEPDMVQLDPNTPDAKPVHKDKGPDGKDVFSYNLRVGRYNVSVAAGPSYASRREESVGASLDLFGLLDPEQRRAMAPWVVRKMDWPGADQAAKVLDQLVPPEVRKVLDEEADPEQRAAAAESQVAQLTQMVDGLGQQLQQAVSQLEDKTAEQALKLQELAQKREKELAEAQSSVEVARLSAFKEIVLELLEQGKIDQREGTAMLGRALSDGGGTAGGAGGSADNGTAGGQ